MVTITEKRRFLDTKEQPTMPFLVVFSDGRRGEAINPLFLMDVIFHKHFSDVEEVETFYLLVVSMLRDMASGFFSMNRQRAIVYDGVGPFYDNTVSRHQDEILEEESLEFKNHDQPIILDGWDPWTAVASLIKAGYLKIYEKVPVWSDRSKKQGCEGCIFRLEHEGQPYCEVWESPYVFGQWDKACPFVTNGSPYSDYHEVLPEEIVDGSFKPGWIPVDQRKKEYIGFRFSSEDKGSSDSE